jgi:ABC-type phosphate/phosphonate transport system substrate-binding protein
MPDLRKSFLVMVLVGLLAVTACGVGVRPVPTLSHDLTTSTPDAGYPTAMPTFTPTPAALGSLENPIIIAQVDPAPSAEQQAAFTDLALLLGGHLQMTVTGRFYNTYQELEFALQRQQAHFAWLQPVEYLLASQKGLATALLVSNHLGVTGYGVQFLGHGDSNFVPYFDVGTHRSTAEAKVALAQLSGLRGCLTEDNSLAGYWLPLGYLNLNNIPTLEPVQTFSYSASIRALYIKGICSFAATYAIAADPRTSSEVIIDLPEVIEKLTILWMSPPVIPNLNLSFTPQVDLTLQSRVSDFLRDYARSEVGKAQLSLALDYEVAALEPLPDSAYIPLRDLLTASGVRLADLLTN